MIHELTTELMSFIIIAFTYTVNVLMNLFVLSQYNWLAASSKCDFGKIQTETTIFQMKHLRNSHQVVS